MRRARTTSPRKSSRRSRSEADRSAPALSRASVYVCPRAMSGAARRAVRLFLPLRSPRFDSAPTRAIGHGWPIEACPRRDARTSRPTKARWRGGKKRATGAPFLLVTFLWASKEKLLAPMRRESEKKHEASGRETRHKTGLPGNNRVPAKYPTRLCRRSPLVDFIGAHPAASSREVYESR